MNYINYLKHCLYQPEVYHRQFENDLPQKESLAKRVALVSLPFLSLYRPAGFCLSVGMGSLRIVTCAYEAFSGEKKVQKVAQMAIASLAVAGTVCNFSLGTLVTTAVDMGQGAVSLLECLRQRKYSKAKEEVLAVLAHSFYLAFLISGGIEWMVAFCLVQTLLSLAQAKGECLKERYLETSAKMVFAGLRLHQAHHFYQALQRRNFLLSFDALRGLMERAHRGRAVRHLIEHPLNDLQAQAEGKKVVLTDAQGKEYEFGAHFHGFGKQLVKGDNLALQVKKVDGKEVLELDFKVNHVFREKIAATLKELKSLSPLQIREILQMAQSHVEHIRWEKGKFSGFEGQSSWLAQTEKVHLVGLGSIMVGNDSEVPNLYDRVVIELPAASTIYDLHEMISFLGLEEALQTSTMEDLDRIKLGHLYRIFFPREATPLERSEEFFTLPLEELKEKMFQLSPGMKEVYEDYFHKMKPYEILPGRVRYQVTGLSEKAYELGARALTAAITGVYQGSALFDRVVSILKMGILSIETRYEHGLCLPGLSLSSDLLSGGADSVYTQMFTEKNIRDRIHLNNLYYSSKVRLLFSLEALETGSYQFYEDALGVRKFGSWYADYWDRPGTLEFVENLQKIPNFFTAGHEVMFKERLAPSFIKGLIVDDPKTYDQLLQHLRQHHLIQKDPSGAETLFNVPVDRFIRIGTRLTEELLK